MAKRKVHDAIAVAGSGAEHVKIADIAATNFGAGGGDGAGGRVGASEAEDRVIGGEQLGHDGRADPAGRAGDEYAQGIPPSRWRDRRDPAQKANAMRWTRKDVSYCRQASTP